MIRDKSHLSAGAITANMTAAAPPGQERLSRWARLLLQELTASLIAACPDAGTEYERFLSIGQRELAIPEPDLSGATVLVTGGTGCIGTALLRQLKAIGAGQLASVSLASISRGITAGYPEMPGVQYEYADIRDQGAVAWLMNLIRPDVVFHVAAQRDPGLADRGVHETVSTNVLGTANVLSAAADAGVPRLVYASTGKALRPYSPEIYTASKKAAEFICAETARTTGMTVSAGRFTHVVDNSIIHDRLLAWAGDPGAVVRLHSPDIVFYVQSARESAQLLMSAAGQPGELRIHAINDLGWPVSLLDVTLAVLDRAGSKVPVYFSGYGKGYESPVPDGLYDPEISWNISPLINGAEARNAVDSRCPATDAFRYAGAGNPRVSQALEELQAMCAETTSSQAVRSSLDRVSRALNLG